MKILLADTKEHIVKAIIANDHDLIVVCNPPTKEIRIRDYPVIELPVITYSNKQRRNDNSSYKNRAIHHSRKI